MITVVGGNKGGSGKTTIASNLAIALANKGREVCLLKRRSTTNSRKNIMRNEKLQDCYQQ
ncbi:P-loop NTPase [Escherichia coli]